MGTMGTMGVRSSMFFWAGRSYRSFLVQKMIGGHGAIQPALLFVWRCRSTIYLLPKKAINNYWAG